MPQKLPILYSFRRCPYAIRTRLTLRYCQIRVELREVKLSQKPIEMLNLSAKGTVPVLTLADGTVLDESLDIMNWALSQQDPDNWKLTGSQQLDEQTLELIVENDNDFKKNLDAYKYADRYPDHPAVYYRKRGERFLQNLDQRLSMSTYLVGDHLSMADIAILPFVRQFAHVDRDWFFSGAPENVVVWIQKLLNTPLFQSVMQKQKPWLPGAEQLIF